MLYKMIEVIKDTLATSIIFHTTLFYILSPIYVLVNDFLLQEEILLQRFWK